MNTISKRFENPNVDVKFSQIKVNITDYTFQLVLGTKTKRQRIYREETVQGAISKELRKWLCEMFDERETIETEEGTVSVKTGKRTTGFQNFLNKQGIEFKPGVLKEMVFQSDNKSDNYSENPFKMIRYINGKNTLTLVNVGVKQSVGTTDPNTGEIKERWKQTFVKIGERYTPAFFGKKSFIRLKINLPELATS